MLFCTFSAFAQKIFKEWGCNFSWSFDKVMRSKSMKMVFVARIIRHKLCMIYAFFDFFCSKVILSKNHSLISVINLTTRGPLYTCLVWPFFFIYKGLPGARCKSGYLCWRGFVCRFWIYVVVRPDLFLFFQNKPSLALQIKLKIGD